MIRVGAVVIASLAALVLSAVAQGVPEGDSVTGTIERLSLAGNETTTHVNARSGSNGEAAQGMYWQLIERPGIGLVESRGNVTCLSVDGNRAAVRATVDVSTDPLIPAGVEVQIEIEDNGSPGGGNDKTILYTGFSANDGCPAFFDVVWATVVDGNYTVRDN
jgi:hypothetical protein